MKPGLKSLLILFSVVLVFGTVSSEEADAQGPIIKRLRELNGGKPLLPFVSDPQPVRPPASREPTPAKKKSSEKGKAGSKTPTPANKPTPAKRPTSADSRSKDKYPPVKLRSPDKSAADQSTAAQGFGMFIQESGDRFIISQVNPRGNAAAAGLQRGDVIENIGGAPIKVVEEFEAIGKAMKGGDRVEFEVSRRGSKPEKVNVQFGKAPPVEQPKDDEPNKIEIAPSLDLTPAVRERPRYVPEVGSGLKSVYDGANKPSSIFEPTPAPTTGRNTVQSLEELDFPALEGGK